ncbi:hypothetical protein C0J52_20065 [Blattella germanica]|nr:hypothetical protein C0J52_20065 [Blattella germanica]
MCQRMMSDVLKKDLTPCDYFLWSYVKEALYVPPLPITLDNLRNRVTTAVHSITVDTLARVWDLGRVRLPHSCLLCSRH